MLLEKSKRYRNIKLGHYANVEFLMKEVIKIIERELAQHKKEENK